MTAPNGITLKMLVAAMSVIIAGGTALLVEKVLTDQDEASRRLTTLERDYAALHTDISYIKSSLLRIEGKLER